MKKRHFTLVMIFAVILINLSQAQTKKTQVPTIFNASDPKDLKEFTQLNLDDNHPDLLAPTEARNDKENVVNSWVDFHKRMGAFLKKNNFSWGQDAKNVAIYHRIYFNPAGYVSNYLFNIRDPKVSDAKKEEFAKLLAQFTTDNRLKYTRTSSFAQCGKTRF